MQQTLVLAPAVDYAKVSQALLSLGWRSVLPPAPNGREPQSNTFIRPDGEEVQYASDPSVSFRMLDLSGVADWMRRLAIAAALPALTDHELQLLLQTDSRRQILLGLLACEARDDRRALDGMQRHLTSADPDIAETARRCVARLSSLPE